MKNCFNNFYQGKRVLVTGHTGFKGAWLTEWLLNLGAEVCGIALPPTTNPNLFNLLKHEHYIRHIECDIKDSESIKNYISGFRPDVIFHLAAQAIVSASYKNPLETFSTNVIGTANILDSARKLKNPCAVVVVTSDKCYENIERPHHYREHDRLGGHDPYSASKACAEIVTSSFRRSFAQQAMHPLIISSVRAGNVIGGGDWSENRIIPDCIKSLENEQTIIIRNRLSIRPWQHVLEPLSGYLTLAQKMFSAISLPKAQVGRFADSFNFGPYGDAHRTVTDLVMEVLKHWKGTWIEADKSNKSAFHEAGLLHLSIDKAKQVLQWEPVWDFEAAVKETISWYHTIYQNGPETSKRVSLEQINRYIKDAANLGIPWADIEYFNKSNNVLTKNINLSGRYEQ